MNTKPYVPAAVNSTPRARAKALPPKYSTAWFRARAKALPPRHSKAWVKLSSDERSAVAMTRAAPWLDALSSSFADGARAAEMSGSRQIRDALESLQGRADTLARIASNWASFSDALERDDSREEMAWLVVYGFGVAVDDAHPGHPDDRPWEGLVYSVLDGFVTELFFMIEYLARLDAERDARLLEKLERLAKRCAAGVP